MKRFAPDARPQGADVVDFRFQISDFRLISDFNLHSEFCILKSRYSERSASITSTRAARAAGNSDAMSAAAKSTAAAPRIGNAPGTFTSGIALPTRRASA